MKMLYLLVLLSSIYIIKSSLYGFKSDKKCKDYQGKTNSEYQAFSKDFCRTLILENTSNKCCHIRYETGEGTFFNCVELNLNQFYNIKETKNYYQTEFSASKINSLECDSSSYLYTSLLLILIFLF